MGRFRVILEPQPEGGFTVYVPALPGCVSEGETEQEALANIVDAIKLYMESLVARGMKPPEVKEYKVEVEV